MTNIHNSIRILDTHFHEHIIGTLIRMDLIFCLI